MFKKNPKIVSITSCSSGDFLFVFGLAKNGAVYIWNSANCQWLPHQNQQQPAPEAN